MMSSAEDLSATPPSDREIVSARSFAVRRELLFKAWTDPQHLQRWWGPNGFTNTFEEFDPHHRDLFAVAANEQNFDRLEAELAAMG
jgi:uncharacterized protein YndB with AHSA1/START domain